MLQFNQDIEIYMAVQGQVLCGEHRSVLSSESESIWSQKEVSSSEWTQLFNWVKTVQVKDDVRNQTLRWKQNHHFLFPHCALA